jgi:2-keto-4-pentenoate hydratase
VASEDRGRQARRPRVDPTSAASSTSVRVSEADAGQLDAALPSGRGAPCSTSSFGRPNCRVEPEVADRVTVGLKVGPAGGERRVLPELPQNLGRHPQPEGECHAESAPSG